MIETRNKQNITSEKIIDCGGPSTLRLLLLQPIDLFPLSLNLLPQFSDDHCNNLFL